MCGKWFGSNFGNCKEQPTKGEENSRKNQTKEGSLLPCDGDLRGFFDNFLSWSLSISLAMFGKYDVGNEMAVLPKVYVYSEKSKFNTPHVHHLTPYWKGFSDGYTKNH